MKTIKIIIPVLLVFFAFAGNAQRTTSKAYTYFYTLYPNVKFSKDIDKFYVQENFSQAFLCGENDLVYDTVGAGNTIRYNYKKKESVFKNQTIGGLDYAENEGLKVVIDVKTPYDAAGYVKHFDQKTSEMVNADNALALIGKMKEKLLFIELAVYEGDKQLCATKFDWTREYPVEYIDYYKDKIGKEKYESYDKKMAFSDDNAVAMYFLGDNLSYTNWSIYSYLQKMVATTAEKAEFNFYTGAGKKHDYSELDALQQKALAAAKNKDKAKLRECSEAWLKIAKTADFDDKKAKITANVAGALYINIAEACAIAEDFEFYATVSQTLKTERTKLKRSDANELRDKETIVYKLQGNRQTNAHRL